MVNPRTKGKRFEYAVRDEIRKYFPCDKCQHKGVRRTPMSGAIDGFKGDITLCPHNPMKQFSLECKNVENINIWKCLKQAIDQAGTKVPALCFTRNFEEVFVALRIKDFLSLIKEVEDYKEMLQDASKEKEV